MPRITKRPNLTVADVLKQKKIEKAKVAKEKEIAIQKAKELQTDTFIRNTARDIIKKSNIFGLQVFENKDVTRIPGTISENSVWAPWSKSFKK